MSGRESFPPAGASVSVGEAVGEPGTAVGAAVGVAVDVASPVGVAVGVADPFAPGDGSGVMDAAVPEGVSVGP